MNNNGTKLFHILDQKSLENLNKAGFDLKKLENNIKEEDKKEQELVERKKRNIEEKRMLSFFFSAINKKNKAANLIKLKKYGAIYTNVKGRIEFRPFSQYKSHFMNYVKNYVNTHTNYRPGYTGHKRRGIRR